MRRVNLLVKLVCYALIFLFCGNVHGYVSDRLEVDVTHERLYNLLGSRLVPLMYDSSAPQIADLYHPLVNICLDRFLEPSRKASFQKELDRLWIYEANMRSIFRSVGIPDELIYLSLVESGVRIHARSSAGALGIWQLMPGTARMLGLKVNGRVDERLDPLKSTWAVARYLKRLYEHFKSWTLALAAYNMGENGLEARIRRFKTRDFFELAKKRAIPVQTRYYVPRVLAAVRIGRFPAVYGFSLEGKLRVLAIDSVLPPRGFSLYSLSQALGIDFSVMRKLNPAIRNPYCPLPSYSIIHIPWSVKYRYLNMVKNSKPYGDMP